MQVVEADSVNEAQKRGLSKLQQLMLEKVADYNKTMPGWTVPTPPHHVAAEPRRVPISRLYLDGTAVSGEVFTDVAERKAENKEIKHCGEVPHGGVQSREMCEQVTESNKTMTDGKVPNLLANQGGVADTDARHASFAGIWDKACIHDRVLTWNEGEDVPVTVTSAKSFQMIYCEKRYGAELRSGVLVWDDGEVWTRRRAEFEGDWTWATIDEHKLIWKEGEEVAIQPLSATTFQMRYEGISNTAELRHDGKLHWDDGDVWTRRSKQSLRECGVCPPWCSRPRGKHLSNRDGRGVSCEVISHRASSQAVPPRQTRLELQNSCQTVPCSKAVAEESAQRQTVAAQAVVGVMNSSKQCVIVSKPVDERRYQGVVTWFRGSYGWVKSAKVAAKYPDHWIFLHVNDCDSKPRQGDSITFQVSIDVKSNSGNKQVKAVHARKVTQAQVISARDFIGKTAAEQQRLVAGR